jgi:hypothetical protein
MITRVISGVWDVWSTSCVPCRKSHFSTYATKFRNRKTEADQRFEWAWVDHHSLRLNPRRSCCPRSCIRNGHRSVPLIVRG